MTTTNTNARIAELTVLVNEAKIFNADGRQAVANACKELYLLIEEDVVLADKEWMLKGMYNDLCNGNFAEPFLCENKKHEFKVVAKVYADNIVPYL